jgi:hypothetical protein
MSWITIIWSAELGACFMMLLVHLLIWSRDWHSWANLVYAEAAPQLSKKSLLAFNRERRDLDR